MSHPTTALTKLRRYYASIIAQSKYQADQASAQLQHIDALLANGLLKEDMPKLDATESGKVLPEIAVIQASATKTSNQKVTQAQSNTLNNGCAESEFEAVRISSSRESQSLLPVYKGMTKLEAIAQVLNEHPSHALHQDDILQRLYGNLNSEQKSLESRRIRASLFQGLKKKLWRRVPEQPSCYVIESNKTRQPLPYRMVQKSVDLSKLSFDPDAQPIWELAAQISAKVPDEEWVKVPSDLSQRFDYYQGLRDDS